MTKAPKAKMTPGDLLAIYEALDKVQAIIEFDLDGTVLSANENFLRTFGYELDEIVGKHHRLFCEPTYAESDEYAEFWKKLGRGEFHAAEFKRLAKGGRSIWLRASYNPVLDKSGKPIRIACASGGRYAPWGLQPSMARRPSWKAIQGSTTNGTIQ